MGPGAEGSMKCANCPLFSSWNNESDRGENCGLFGDGWDSDFQYEDKEGAIVGCYIDRHFIEKVDAKYVEQQHSAAESRIEALESAEILGEK